MNQPLHYRGPEPKRRTDWERVFWIVATVLFVLMCLFFLIWMYYMGPPNPRAVVRSVLTFEARLW